ncbi:MAG: RDD family protein [Thermodesulfobacteriota bacterium]
MVNCVECGAPMRRATEACEACGARPSSGHLNGTPHPELEEDDGLVYEADAPRLRDDEEHAGAHHADAAPHRHGRGEPSFVSQPLQDDPTVTSPPFVAAPLATDAEERRAGFVRRAVALLADLVLLGLLDVVLFALATSAVVTAERLSGARVGDAADLVAALLSAGSTTLTIGYFSVLHARSGQTLGKAALGIRVVGRDRQPIGIARSIVRTAGYGLSLLTLGAGFLLALAPSRRALHDLVAGTVVVRARGGA